MLEGDAGVELAAGAAAELDELSDPEWGFAAPSLEPDDESLLPSLPPDPPSPDPLSFEALSDFGAEDDFDG